MKKILFAIVFILNVIFGNAQQISEINYLNMTPPPSDSAVVFAKGLVSKKGRWDEKITFSPDGKEVFWGIHPDNKNYFRPYIMHSRLINKKWSEPDTLAYSKNRKLGWPLLSPDGDMLFMEEVTEKSNTGVTGNIVCSKREKEGWSAPVTIIPEMESKEGFGLAQITRDGTFYFYDRFMHVAYSAKLKDGKVSKPTPLPYTVNPAVEFFVSPENDYIIFKPISWHTETHISFRTKNDEWTLPLALSDYFKKNPKFAGIGEGGAPSVSPDGKYYFFVRWGEIYWVRTDFIEILRKKAIQAQQ